MINETPPDLEQDDFEICGDCGELLEECVCDEEIDDEEDKDSDDSADE